MAAESERPPYLNGASGRSNPAKDAEPAPDAAAHRAASEGDTTDRSAVKSQSQAMSQIPKLPPNPSASSTPASTSNSAVSSRESSPVRTTLRPVNSSSATRIRSVSRKSSQDRSSPTRSPSKGPPSGTPTNPSPAASAQRAPAAQPTSNPPILSPPAPDPPANVLGSEDSNMPSWAGNRRTEQESTQPNTSHKRTSLPPSEEHGKVDRSAPRAVTRGVSGQGPALETVQEMASNPSTPSSDTAAKPVTPDDSRLHTIDEDPTPRAAKQNAESGSDSGGNRSSEAKEDSRSNATGATKPSGTVMPKRSTTSLSAGARGKPADGSVRNMIVETETVSSIPQVSMGVGSAERGNASRTDQGTLRMKPSTETIRPRKEKKKNHRRPNPLTTGPASSKADIFEAKVASAVDEADVSDSDETFVYESNPPDPYPARPPRYHSRTPSATSMASQADQLAGRGRGVRDGAHSVTGKRSMKFTNNTYNNNMDGEVPEANGTRNNSLVENGTITPRHHHLSRHARNGMQSLFDGDSSYPQPQSLKSPRHYTGGGYRHSRNSNTRSSPNYKTINGTRKAGDLYGYDFDAEGADDERTPLVGTPRATRSRHGRRPNSASARQIEHMAQYQRGYLSRYGSCFVILLMLVILAGGVTSFIIAATKTLLDVQVVAIQNVLASEQEIMLDLNVEAINPNIFPVTIDDTDINIFAKSRYVGTDKLWREHGSDQELDHFPRVEQSRRRWKLSQVVRCLGNMDCVEQAMSRQNPPEHTQDGIDKGTDPISDPEGDSQTMLLGRVFRFDSPLSFGSTPWTWSPSTSKGQIRLPQPGNKTEEGGTERWERVLQHEFELIVRGVVKYQLPLNSRFHSSSISSSIKVVPDNDDNHGPNDPDPTPPSNETARISIQRKTAALPLAESDAHPEQRSGVSPRQFTA